MTDLSHYASMAAAELHICAAEIVQQYIRPSAIYRPILKYVYDSRTENSYWTATYGDYFKAGNSPKKAMENFDKGWED